MSETRKPVVAPGDIFKSSWGYDQTNIDFYQVVKISASGKTVWIRSVPSRVVDGRVVPDLRVQTCVNLSKLARRKLHDGWNGDGWISLTSYSGASKWDGTPAYDTTAAGEAGH